MNLWLVCLLLSEEQFSGMVSFKPWWNSTYTFFALNGSRAKLLLDLLHPPWKVLLWIENRYNKEYDAITCLCHKRKTKIFSKTLPIYHLPWQPPALHPELLESFPVDSFVVNSRRLLHLGRTMDELRLEWKSWSIPTPLRIDLPLSTLLKAPIIWSRCMIRMLSHGCLVANSLLFIHWWPVPPSIAIYWDFKLDCEAHHTSSQILYTILMWKQWELSDQFVDDDQFWLMEGDIRCCRKLAVK